MHKKFYKQIDGVNSGLSNLGIKVIYFLPTVYLHYIDDICCVFDKESVSLAFLQILNLQHTSIKFAREKETNSKSLDFS